MPNTGPFTNSGNSQTSSANNATAAASGKAKAEHAETGATRAHFQDMQSATRFPIKLPISVKSTLGESQTETENISANGVLFRAESDMPLGSIVDFTISLPAGVLGTECDVQLDCRGRVVRSSDEDGRKGIGVVIDEYRFDRR
jgi:PilZ domain-containing protein